MNKKVYSIDNENNMNYEVFYPDSFKELPLMVYLHGAGERGEDITHLDRHAIPELIKNGRSFKAVVLCIQCPARFVWDNVVVDVKRIIDSVAGEYNILPDRICCTGSSMGGYGTWSMGLTYRNFFSGIAPIAGGGMAWRCGNLRTTPVYAMHGAIDSVVDPIYSKLMVDAVNAKGGSAKLLLFDGKDHNDGIDYAYESTDVIEWLLKQRRTDFTYVPECLEEMF